MSRNRKQFGPKPVVYIYYHVAAVHGRCRPVEATTSTVDHRRRGPGWHEERAHTVHPRQDHSGFLSADNHDNTQSSCGCRRRLSSRRGASDAAGCQSVLWCGRSANFHSSRQSVIVCCRAAGSPRRRSSSAGSCYGRRPGELSSRIARR